VVVRSEAVKHSRGYSQTRFGCHWCHWLCQCSLRDVDNRFSTGRASGTRKEADNFFRDSSRKPTGVLLETPLAVRGTREQEQTEENREEAKMPRASSLQLSRFPLFPPVKTCLRTGLLGIDGRD